MTLLFPILSFGIPYLLNNSGRVRNAVVVTEITLGIIGNTYSLRDLDGHNITDWIRYESFIWVLNRRYRSMLVKM